MKFTANQKYFFYPDINGNLDLPEGERLSVEIVRPTAEERDSICWYESVPRGLGTDGAIRIRYNASLILREKTGAIKNLSVTDNAGKDRPVNSGAELAGASFTGMVALVNAICAEVCSDHITEAQKKISG